MKPESHYDALEVSRNASPEVIKAAYKSLMQRYHPDRNPEDAQAAERSIRVSQAYEILSDAGKRAAYDLVLQDQRSVVQDGIALRASHLSRVGVGKESAPASNGWLGPIFILIVVALGYVSFNHIRNSLHAAPASGALLLVGEIPTGQTDSAGMAVPVSARTMPALYGDIKVELEHGSTEQPGLTSPVYVLTIPSIDVSVGAFDSERFISFMESNKAYIELKLIERLAEAEPGQLRGVNGEQYLKRYLLEALADIADTPLSPDASLRGENRYGIESISLPESYNLAQLEKLSPAASAPAASAPAAKGGSEINRSDMH